MANNFDLLQQNGSTITDSYNFLQEENIDLYHTTNANSLSPIVKSLNQGLKYLNFVQNEYNTLNNLNQEALYKKDQLLKLHNDDLSNQLNILDKVQSNIANKDRIIDQTNLSIEDYDLNIKINIAILILSIILFTSVILFGNGVINNTLIKTIFTMIIILFVLLWMCIFNIFNFRVALKSLLSKDIIQKAAYGLEYLGEKAYSDVKNDINKLKTDWVNANCKCPVTVSEEDDVYGTPGNVIINEIPGIFYYDGTAPQQLLIPTPIPNELNLNQQIEWPDYSPDGSVKYNAANNKLEYINNNYYNIANNKAPLIMESTNPYTAPLTSSTTYTANL